MDEWDGIVWVVERNHKPLVQGGRIACFPCGGDGTNDVRAYLNSFPVGERDYYDAVLYETRARKNLKPTCQEQDYENDYANRSQPEARTSVCAVIVEVSTESEDKDQQDQDNQHNIKPPVLLDHGAEYFPAKHPD